MFIHDERKVIIYCQVFFYSFTYYLLFNYSSFLHSGQCGAASMKCSCGNLELPTEGLLLTIPGET